MSTMRQRRAHASPREKRMARELAALSGAPYLHSVYTIRTLARLRERLDLGDLVNILDGRHDRRPIGLPVDNHDLVHLARLLELGLDCTGRCIATSGATNETRLLIDVAIGGCDLVYEHVLAGPLHPAATWVLDLDELATQLASEAEQPQPSLVAHATSSPESVDVPIPADHDGVAIPAGLFREASTPSKVSAGWPIALRELALVMIELAAIGDDANVVIYDLQEGNARWSGIDLPTHQTLWYRHPVSTESAGPKA